MKKTKILLAGLMFSLSANATNLEIDKACENALVRMKSLDNQINEHISKNHPIVVSSLVMAENVEDVRFISFCSDALSEEKFESKSKSINLRIKKNTSALIVLMKKQKEKSPHLSEVCRILEKAVPGIEDTISLESKYNKSQENSKILNKMLLTTITGACMDHINSDSFGEYRAKLNTLDLEGDKRDAQKKSEK